MSRIENPIFLLDDGGLYVKRLIPCIGKDGGQTNREDTEKADPYDWRRLLDRLDRRPPSPEPPQELAQNE